MYDFHTHTFLSDGVLSPVELIRRALARGTLSVGEPTLADGEGL